jgi:hypothetical protein
VSDWTGVFLGIIAVSVLTMAIIQVGAIIFGLKLARRIDQLSTTIERDVRPVLERLAVVSDDAARMSQLALAQVQRADALFGDVAKRIDQSLSSVQSALLAPAREGVAVFQALKAVFSAIRAVPGAQAPGARTSEEDDQLFIG